jgi:hypothetical protein
MAALLFLCTNKLRHSVLEHTHLDRTNYQDGFACGTTNVSANFATRQHVSVQQLVTHASIIQTAQLVRSVKWTGKMQCLGHSTVHAFHLSYLVSNVQKTSNVTSSHIVGIRTPQQSSKISQPACRCINRLRVQLSVGSQKIIMPILLRMTILLMESFVTLEWLSIVL